MNRVSYRRLACASAIMASFLWSGTGNAQPSSCLYVVGFVQGKTVATPAVGVVVPELEADVPPVQVHLDPISMTIAGFVLTTPGINGETPPQNVFVPATAVGAPAMVASVKDLNIPNTELACVSRYGYTTPAVPVHIPRTAVTSPYAEVYVPPIKFKAAGHQQTVGGQVIPIGEQGQEYVLIPEVDEEVPSQPLDTHPPIDYIEVGEPGDPVYFKAEMVPVP